MKQHMTQRQLNQMLIQRQNQKRVEHLIAADVHEMKIEHSSFMQFFKNCCAIALVIAILFGMTLQILYGLADDIDRQTAIAVKHQLQAEWGSDYAK